MKLLHSKARNKMKAVSSLIALCTLCTLHFVSFGQILNVTPTVNTAYTNSINFDFDRPIDPTICFLTSTVWPEDNLKHYANPYSFLSQPLDEVKKSCFANGDWTKTLRFRARFDANCNYNIGVVNQPDWNKLMSISLATDSDQTSVRMGWRYNIVTQRMELGLYGHINHFASEDRCVNMPGSCVGREFLFLTSIGLNTEHDLELVFSSGGIGVIVDDEGSFIKRQIILPATIDAKITRSAYFGGQSCPPKDMDIEVWRMVKNGTTNWHRTCAKTFSRSIFYGTEQQTITAGRTILLSDQVFRGQDKASGVQCKWEENNGDRFTLVENGAAIIMKAGQTITMKPGFHAKKGATFSAAIDGNIVCEPFRF